MSNKDYKQSIAEHFNSRSQYGVGTPHSGLVERLIELYPPQPNDRVLDIATGTGFVAIIVANIIGPLGGVVGIDISPFMVEQAKAAAAQYDLSRRIHFMLADAENLPTDLGQFDRIYCANAIPYLQDVRGTLGKWRNLLKPSGFIAFNCWQENSYATGRRLRQIAATHGIAMAKVGVETGTPERIESLLRSAGYDQIIVKIEPTNLYVQPKQLENFTEMTLSNPLYGISPAERASLLALVPEYQTALFSDEVQEDFRAERGAYFVSARAGSPDTTF
ncbi:class I SAM-dependent methyltransferase [Acidithiobacillus sp. AC3]